ncbi:MAG: hypothetical protein J7J70_11620 [Deltaproteobacteria bacterium]|nr:hypothetical protein [Candidatus Tharpellaceae bacterium]
MKEGYIIYVIGEETPKETELKVLIKENRLDLFEYQLCGNKPLPGIYRAYQALQQRRVTAVNCLAVRFDKEAGNYVFLDQAMSLDGFADLNVLCSAQELAC